MKKLFILLLLLVVGRSYGQTTIYSQTFNSGSAPDWTLNSSDLGGDVTLTGNQWIINNSYVGPPPLGSTTPSQPSGITGFPNSYYMHIYCGPTLSSLYGTNCNYNASGSATHFAYLSTATSTTGYTGVSFSFWWICQGDATTVGKVYYRTSTSGTWTLITTPITNYNLSSTWTKQTITMAAFDNQATLEFAFQFNQNGSGSDPAFGIDEIEVKGTASTGVKPVASFTTSPTPATICTDSCLTLTSTSTISVGTIDSVAWYAVYAGFPVRLSNANPFSLCTTAPFNVPGTYNVRLRAYGGSGYDSANGTVTVNASPHPAITKTGKTLSVPSTGYTSYKWYNASGPISGATNASYTYSVSGTYTILVDSGGCKGMASMTVSTAGISLVTNAENTFWSTQESGNLTIHAAENVFEPLNISIYDATGRTVFRQPWPRGDNSVPVSTSGYAQGLYIIKLSNERMSTILKLMK